MPEVERIIRASLVTRDLPQFAEMERIRRSAVRRNARSEIHAVLLYQSGWYVHWAEGPGAALADMLARVDRDQRHHAPRVVHHTRGPRYLLTRWSMMIGSTAEPREAFAVRVEELYRARQAGVQFPPTSVIRRLAAPLRVRAQAADQLEAFHRIGVCSADDGRCFEFVRWLSQRPHALRQTRRVAGEDDMDSASEYAEFMFEGEACRVIGVSRAALQHGLRRAMLPDWPYLVLLFGDDAKRNRVLMERTLEACRDLPTAPLLLGAATETGVHARMQVACRGAGLRYGQLGQMGQMDARDHEALWQALGERLREAGAPPSSQWDTTHPAWVG